MPATSSRPENEVDTYLGPYNRARDFLQLLGMMTMMASLAMVSILLMFAAIASLTVVACIQTEARQRTNECCEALELKLTCPSNSSLPLIPSPSVTPPSPRVKADGLAASAQKP